MSNSVKHTIAIFLVVTLLGLTACGLKDNPHTQSAQPTISSSPTSSQILNGTATNYPVPTATANASRLVTKCAQVLDDSNSSLSGVLAIKKFVEGVNSFLFDLQTKSTIDLGKTVRTSLPVSPDGRKVAFSDLDRKALFISDVGGKQIKTIPDPELLLTPTYWLDNDHLAIDKVRPTDVHTPPLLDALVIFNLETGEMKEFLPDYPNFYDISGEVQWRSWSRLEVNPALTYLVYPALEYGSPTILWDLLNSREVARVYWGAIDSTPQWAPDGTHFVTSAPIRYTPTSNDTFVNVQDNLPYVGGHELLDISQTGEIKRLTFLTTQYPAEVLRYVWSPDGQFIAFEMELTGASSSNKPRQLGILNVRTGEVTNYCIEGIFVQPVWSLDGKQLAINVSPGGLKHLVFILDIERGIAMQVAEDAVVEGWMLPIK